MRLSGSCAILCDHVRAMQEDCKAQFALHRCIYEEKWTVSTQTHRLRRT